MARYNSALTSNTITGTATIGSPYSGAFTEFTGTAPYTVTLPTPLAFPGVTQTFYNATSGTVTLSTPSGNFVGTGGPGASTALVYSGNVVGIVSDGTNYVVISEDGSPLIATTGSFSSNVTINGGSATLSVTPSVVTMAPTASSTIDNIAVGATTRASGAFTTLTANNAVTFTANTASSSTTTGSLVVTGGIGASGTVYAGAFNGNLTGTLQTAAQTNITSVGSLSSLTVAGAISGSTTLQVGANPAGVSIGVIGIPNQKRIYGRNTANNADVNMMFVNGSDSLVVGPSDVASFASTGLTVSGTTTSTQFRNNGASGHYGWTAGSQGAIFTTNATPGLAAQFIVDNAGRGTSISTQDDNASSTGTQFRLGLGASTGATNATMSVNNNTTGGYGALSIGSSSVIFNRIAGESMRIHTDGNVGIGATSPNTTLHVKSTVAGSTNGLTLEYNAGTAYYARLFSNGNDLYVSADTGNTGGKMFLQTAGTTAIAVDASQKVGIGTILPVALLDVSSGTNTTLSVPAGVVGKFKGSITLNSLSTASSGNIDSIFFQKSHASGINISNYDLGIIKSFTGNGYTGGLDFFTGKSLGAGSYGATFAMRIDETQQVGIGSSSPANKLDVRGTLGIGTASSATDNAFTFSSVNGSANNHTHTFQGPASGTNDDLTFNLSRGGGAYGSFTIAFIGSTRLFIAGSTLNNSGHTYIAPAANLGVGYTTPSEKLSVNGNITAGNTGHEYRVRGRNQPRLIYTVTPSGSMYSTQSFVWSTLFDTLQSTTSYFDSGTGYMMFLTSSNGAHSYSWKADIRVGGTAYGATSQRYRVSNMTEVLPPWPGGCGPSAFSSIDNTGFTYTFNPCYESVAIWIIEYGV